MIDQAALQAVLRRAGMELLACDRLSAGASRETYRLKVRDANGERLLALRRGAGGEETPLLGVGPGLDAEPYLFRAARSAGAPAPEVVLELARADGLGAGFAMEWIEGETLGGRIARGAAFGEARKLLARQCGETLARLHAIDLEASGLTERLARLTPEAAIRRTHAAYRAFGDPQPMIDYAGRWLLDHLPREGPLTLVHGDFRNGNLIVSPERGVRAVLDWELSHIGDPMRDLGWLCTRSWRFGGEHPVGGFGVYEDLFAGYEAVSGVKVDPEAVRFWEVFGSFWWAVGCLSMAQSWRSGAEPSVERPAIGRRTSECQIDCVNMLIPGPARLPDSSLQSLSATGLPSTQELVRSVRNFLADTPCQEGREGFLAKVAANSLATVERELELGASARAREQTASSILLGREAPLESLRTELAEAIWQGAVDLRSPDLQLLLRESVLAQVLIDQPGYSGAVEAAARAKHG
jgi:aminoglycoside phosphotransferase (APT) family kinase protein